MLDNHFFLPTANKVGHRMMKDAARRLIGNTSKTTRRTYTGCGRPSGPSNSILTA